MRAALRAHSPCINQRGETLQCTMLLPREPEDPGSHTQENHTLSSSAVVPAPPPLPLASEQERIINSRKAHIPGPWPFDRERRGSQGEGLRVCWNNLLSWGKIVPVLMRPPGVIPACIVYHGQEKGKTNFISEFGLT